MLFCSARMNFRNFSTLHHHQSKSLVCYIRSAISDWQLSHLSAFFFLAKWIHPAVLALWNVSFFFIFIAHGISFDFVKHELALRLLQLWHVSVPFLCLINAHFRLLFACVRHLYTYRFVYNAFCLLYCNCTFSHVFLPTWYVYVHISSVSPPLLDAPTPEACKVPWNKKIENEKKYRLFDEILGVHKHWSAQQPSLETICKHLLTCVAALCDLCRTTKNCTEKCVGAHWMAPLPCSHCIHTSGYHMCWFALLQMLFRLRHNLTLLPAHLFVFPFH